MITTSALRAIGLTETEASIYLAGLPAAAISASELVLQTGIQRSTVYHALETLLAKGLAAKKRAGGRLAFSMTHPRHLEGVLEKRIAMLEQRKGALRELIPLLEQRTAPEGTGARVSQFEGIEGVKIVVEEALGCHGRTWDIIAPKENFFSQFDGAYAQYYLTTRKRRGIVSRSLWEQGVRGARTPSGKRLTPDILRERNPRFLPAALTGTFSSVVILFDDKVALLSSLRELRAVLIQSPEIRATMGALFEGLWLAAEPPRETPLPPSRGASP